jgi:hypothetical protein
MRNTRYQPAVTQQELDVKYANIFVYRGFIRGYRFLKSVRLVTPEDTSTLDDITNGYLSKGYGIQVLFRDYEFPDNLATQMVSTIASYENLQADEDGSTYTIALEKLHLMWTGGDDRDYRRITQDDAKTITSRFNIARRSYIAVRSPKIGGHDYSRIISDIFGAISILEMGLILI